MKTLLTTLLAVIGLSHVAPAADLPESAKDILDKLAKYEERLRKSTEEEIINKNKEMIKTLERSKSRIKSKGVKKLYTRQIRSLEREIERSERVLNGDEAEQIVDYEVVYHYDHPVKELSEQKGELIFYSNRKVKLRHLNSEGNPEFEHVIRWRLKNGKIYIFDDAHGVMIVTPQKLGSREKVNIKWTKLDKTIQAIVK